MSAVLLLAASAFCAQAPAPAAKTPAGRLIGEVTAVDAAGLKLSIKNDKGEPASVTMSDTTSFVKMPPGETSITKGTRIKLSDISVGDRVMARGQVSEDQKSVSAQMVIVMHAADLAQMHQKVSQEWQTRGVIGDVASIDDAQKRFVLKPRGETAKPVMVEPGEKTAFWRYVPDSIKFKDAKPSKFADIKAGDEVRVLGDKSADGATIKAEQVISGTFKQMAATVVSINAASNEITVNDLLTKKPVTLKVNAEASLKKMPQMLAMMMARRLNPSYTGAPGGAGGGRPAGAAGPGAGGPGGPGGAGPGGGGGMRGPGGGAPDIQQMLDRMQPFTLAELKTGDALIIRVGAAAERLTAFVMLAGVEPLLTAAPERAINFGGWNMGGGGVPE